MSVVSLLLGALGKRLGCLGRGLIVAALAAGCAWNIQGWRGDSRIAKLESNWARERALATHALLVAQEDARKESQRRYEAVNEIRNEADKHLARMLDFERNAADKRLREQATAFAKRQAAACGHSHATSIGASAADPLGMLADLLGELDQMAEAYAREADRRRVAGLACERMYQAMER